LNSIVTLGLYKLEAIRDTSKSDRSEMNDTGDKVEAGDGVADP
jgi:hypothetical protein